MRARTARIQARGNVGSGGLDPCSKRFIHGVIICSKDHPLYLLASSLVIAKIWIYYEPSIVAKLYQQNCLVLPPLLAAP